MWWIEFLPPLTTSPKSLTVREGRMIFNWGKGESELEASVLPRPSKFRRAIKRRRSAAKPIGLRKHLWREFLALDGKADAEIIRFARTHGSITGARAEEESIEDWRRRIRLLSVINAALEGRDDESAWQTIHQETGIPIDDPLLRGPALSLFLKKVVEDSRPQFAFTWLDETFDVKLYTDSLWVGISFQLVRNFLGEKNELVPCGGCGKLLKKRPHSRKQKHQFCQRCRNNKVPMKLVMRRRRARLKRAERKQQVSPK